MLVLLLMFFTIFGKKIEFYSNENLDEYVERFTNH
jgi:hypothetical protein